MLKLCSTMMVGFLLMLALAFPALAIDASVSTGPDSVALFDLLAAIVGGEAAAKWVATIGFIVWVLTQIMAWLPPEWVAKCPSWLITLLKWLAGNYRKAANEAKNDPAHIRQSV